MSVQEDDDFTAGCDGPVVSGSDQALAVRISDQADSPLVVGLLQLPLQLRANVVQFRLVVDEENFFQKLKRNVIEL